MPEFSTADLLTDPSFAGQSAAAQSTSSPTATPSSNQSFSVADLLKDPDFYKSEQKSEVQSLPTQPTAQSTESPTAQAPLEDRAQSDEDADVPEPVLKNEQATPSASAQPQSPYPGISVPPNDHFIDNIVQGYKHDAALGMGTVATDALKGAGSALPAAIDMANLPSKIIGSGIDRLTGWKEPNIPTSLQGYQQLTGKPVTSLAYPVGAMVGNMAMTANGATPVSGALMGAGSNLAQGELNHYAQTGQFDAGKALGEAAVGGTLGALTGTAAAMGAGAKDAVSTLQAVKKEQSAAAVAEKAAAQTAEKEQYLNEIQQQRKANFPEEGQQPVKGNVATAAPPEVPEIPPDYDAWREAMGMRPRKKPHIEGQAEEKVEGKVLPKDNTVREQASGGEIRGESRPPTTDEYKLLHPIAKVKSMHDQAVSDYRTAYRALANKLENPSQAYGPKAQPDAMTTTKLAEVREKARQIAGIEQHLVEKETLEPHFMQVNEKYAPKGYKVKSEHPLALAAEVKHLSQKAGKLEKVYTDLRKKYSSEMARTFKPQEAVHVDLPTGERMKFHNWLQKKYELPANTPTHQAEAYKSARASLNSAEQAAAHSANPQFEERITQLAEAIKDSNPDAAKLLAMKKPILDDQRLMDMADAQGIRPAINALIEDFLKDEAGSATQGGAIGDLLTALPNQIFTFLKDFNEWRQRLAKNPRLAIKDVITMASNIALAKFNHNIIEDHADPLFTAHFQGLKGELLAATFGKDAVPHNNPKWFSLKAKDIAAEPSLTPLHKQALTGLRAVQKDGKEFIEAYITKLESEGPSNPLWGRGRLIRTLKHEVAHNFGGMREHHTGDEFFGFLGANNNQMRQAMGFAMHGNHIVELHAAAQSLAPTAFKDGLAASVTPEGQRLASMLHFKAPIRDMFAEEEHAINQTPVLGVLNKWNNAIGDIIPEWAQGAITGQTLEEAKIHVAVNTAVEVAAKEMQYPGGGNALRRAFISNSLTPTQLLAACTHIQDFMFRSLKAGPAGYSHMSPVDRLAAQYAPAKLFMAFTRAHISQANYITELAKEGAQHLVMGNYADGMKRFGQVLHAQSILIMWGGAAGVFAGTFESLRNAHQEETAEKLENLAENAALIGNLPKYAGLKEGFRSTKTRLDALWWLDANSNVIGDVAHNAKTMTDGNASSDQRRHATLELIQQVGIGNLFKVISLTNADRFLTTYANAERYGQVVQHAYRPGQLWGWLKEDKHAGVMATPATGLEALARTAFFPTESYARFAMQAIDNLEAEETIKGMSIAAHDALEPKANKLFQRSTKIHNRASAARKLNPDIAKPLQVKEAVARTAEDNRPYKEGTRGTFWLQQLKMIRSNPGYLAHLKAHKEHDYRYTMATGKYR